MIGYDSTEKAKEVGCHDALLGKLSAFICAWVAMRERIRPYENQGRLALASDSGSGIWILTNPQRIKR
jgi:hypothetical protein